MRKRTPKQLLALTALCASFLSPPASAQDDFVARLKKFESIDYSKTLLKRSEIEGFIEDDKITIDDSHRTDPGLSGRLRGIVFGKHGRIFREAAIQAYLKSRPWYKPNPKFTNGMLSPTERQNIDLIRGIEAEAHDVRVSPGDLRFWRDRKIPAPSGYVYTIADLQIMRAEIEAIHGKRFDSQPLLQRYFEDRYWYKADPSYSAKVLTPIERANISMLDRYIKEVSGGYLDSGEMPLYADKPIPQKLLRGASMQSLSLARNGIYAVRGRTFRTPWLKEHFDGMEWYVPLADQTKVVLTRNDDRNLGAILAEERKRREDLSKRTLALKDLEGLYVEDLRKLSGELFARHGKVFPDKSLQSYFESQSWYKADPAFAPSALSRVERKNQKTIETALKRTKDVFILEEG